MRLLLWTLCDSQEIERFIKTRLLIQTSFSGGSKGVISSIWLLESLRAQQDLKRWTAPLEGFVKINTDAAVRPSFIAIVCICYNHLGVALWARSEIFARMFVLLAELLAIRMAAGEAKFRELERVVFESDSLSAIASIGDPTLLFDVEVDGVVEAICEIVSFYLSWSFLNSRQANVFADSLAKWAARRRVFGCISAALEFVF